MEICVFEVDWKVFEATFPKPGEWMEVCDSQIDFDAFGFNMECASIYGRVRSKLDEDIVLALDQLFSAVCINGVPKKWNQSTLYKPVVKYDKDQFQFGCDGPLIPRSSPEQVSQILDTFNLIPKGKLGKGQGGDVREPERVCGLRQELDQGPQGNQESTQRSCD